ncbi:hypothetical protein [Qipengyuania sp. 902]|uniref:hypothetical protein n=1 Tax=Qipengyuania sp. 902 TaxID=3417565 RepID=UPI003EB8E938
MAIICFSSLVLLPVPDDPCMTSVSTLLERLRSILESLLDIVYLTKQSDMTHDSGDRPTIEITEAMIEAGLLAADPYIGCGSDFSVPQLEKLVCAILQAALQEIA